MSCIPAYTVAQVGSNIFFLLPAGVALSNGFLFLPPLILMTTVTSSLYHYCDCTGVCFGLTLDLWRRMDYIFAQGQFLNILFLLTLANISAYYADTLTPAQRRTDSFFSTFAFLIAFSIEIYTVVVGDLTITYTKIMVTTVIIIMLVYNIVVSRGRFSFIFHIDPPFFYSAFIFLAYGAFAFLVGNGDTYPILHPPWHIAAGDGMLFLIIGLSKDIQKRRDYLHATGTWLINGMSDDAKKVPPAVTSAVLVSPDAHEEQTSV